VLEGREQRLERLAQASRARLSDLRDQDQHLQEQAQAYEQQWRELSLQILPFEATNQTEERDYFPLKARQLAADWEVRQRKTKLEKHAAQSLRILNKCEGYCRELRQVLRQQEDLEAQARNMYELDQTRVPDYDPLQGGTGQRRDVGTGSVFGESYQHCGWQRLWPFFKQCLLAFSASSQFYHRFNSESKAILVCGTSKQWRWQLLPQKLRETERRNVPFSVGDSSRLMLVVQQECFAKDPAVLSQEEDHETFQVNKTFTSRQYRSENRTPTEQG
jgi:hypothetical protein